MTKRRHPFFKARNYPVEAAGMCALRVCCGLSLKEIANIYGRRRQSVQRSIKTVIESAVSYGYLK